MAPLVAGQGILQPVHGREAQFPEPFLVSFCSVNIGEILSPAFDQGDRAVIAADIISLAAFPAFRIFLQRVRVHKVQPADLTPVCLVFFLFQDPRFPVNLLNQGLSGKRSGIIETLLRFTSDVQQEFPLLVCFHSFCQRMDPQGFRHADQRRQHIFPLRGHFPQKEHIKLDHIEGVILQHIQGRIAASEIIQPDEKTGVSETAERLFKSICIFQHYAFRDLQIDRLIGNGIGIKHRANLFKQILPVKIQPGEIHGYAR